ncbi:MAG: phosphoglycerate dehydrogenase [Thermodesulfobacteriota bacterium]
MRIAVTTSTFAEYSREPLDLLEAAGAEVVLNPLGRKLKPEETIALLAGCDGVVAGTETYDAAVFAALPGLRAVSRCGVGMDSVDQAAARNRGVKVLNTPLGPTRAVAELTVGLALDLLRQVTRMDRELRAGTWKKRMGSLLAGKKVGVVGFGRIGRATAELFAGLGCEIGYSDVAPFADCPIYAKCMELPELLAWADIVTLHCSKPASGGFVLGEAELAAMRPGAWLINCGRGGLVDEDALYRALQGGRLSGAAVDCFGQEPYAGPLAGADTAVLTPHIGSYAREGRARMETDAVKNLLDALGAA